MLAEVIRKIYQLSVRIYQGLAFGGIHRMELARKMGAKWAIWEVRSEVVAWVCSSSVIVMLLWQAKVTKSTDKRKLTTTQSYSQLAVSVEFCSLLQRPYFRFFFLSICSSWVLDCLMLLFISGRGISCGICSGGMPPELRIVKSRTSCPTCL